MTHKAITILSTAILLSACAESWDPVNVDVSDDPPALLSEMNLLRWDGTTFEYNPEIVPYVMNTPLFSDYALKDRAIYVPPGTAAVYDDNDAFDMPVGTVLIKSFSFPADFRSPDEDIRMIETRLLIHYETGWKAYPYIWNEEATDAELKLGGGTTSVDFIDIDGEAVNVSYLVPQRNQCISCHELKDPESGDKYFTPIGIKARHLNRDLDYADGTFNQLEYLADRGALTGLPALSEVPRAYDFRALDLHEFNASAIDDLEGAELDKAARDYLDINCAHCHNPNGVNGISSQLFLNHDNESAFNLGVCKKPGSAGKGGAGRDFDIVPGDSYASILWYRMDTEDAGSMMPLLGRYLAHDEGVDLVARWIDAMEPNDCAAD